MGMDMCKRCRTRFKYKDLLKGFFSFTNDISCGNCGVAHEMTLMSRIIPIILILLPSFLSIWSESIRDSIRAFPNPMFLFLLVFFYLALVIALSLFMSRYKLKKSK